MEEGHLKWFFIINRWFEHNDIIDVKSQDSTYQKINVKKISLQFEGKKAPISLVAL